MYNNSTNYNVSIVILSYKHHNKELQICENKLFRAYGATKQLLFYNTLTAFSHAHLGRLLHFF